MSTGELRRGWRDEAWAELVHGSWDVLVIGGGITGVGIARRAAQAGLRTALVEQRDFAWGTSSRSSKLVHGGLRYLATGQVGIARQSISGRQALLRAAPGLVEELSSPMPLYRGAKPGRAVMTAGLVAYDLLARRRSLYYLSKGELLKLVPALRAEGLIGGFRYGDAWTDDARLVMRVLADARQYGAVTLSYARVTETLRDVRGNVTGAAVRDDGPDGGGRTAEIRATVVINATGAAADTLRNGLGGEPRIRPLRGSHLIFPAEKLPETNAVFSHHPADGRSAWAYSWDGVTIVGTTDVDAPGEQVIEPHISAAEIAYIEAWLAYQFPSLRLTADDAIASIAGIRPVIGTGKANPSAESREHMVWEERGLVTVTGGKLTTFDAVALDALRRVAPRLGGRRIQGGDPLDPLSRVQTAPGPKRPETVSGPDLSPAALRRLFGRHGRDTWAALEAAEPEDTATIESTNNLWLEVRWAARAEGVVHLDDLLLRRVRLGLQLPGGGAGVLDRVRSVAQAELGWDDARWAAEEAAYRRLWADSYAPRPEESGRDPERQPVGLR